jgi:hypothetical protein
VVPPGLCNGLCELGAAAQREPMPQPYNPIRSRSSELSLPRMLRKSSVRCLNGDFDDDDMLDK